MIDDIALIIGRLIVWFVIVMGGVLCVACLAGVVRDAILKLKRR